MKKLLIIFISVLFILNMVNPVLAQFFFTENILEKKKAPDFTLDTTRAKAVNLAKYRQNQKTILFFWATWCPHCREQLKELNKIKQDLVNKKIKLILIDLGESEKLVVKHLQKQKMDFEVFLDKDSSVSEKYNLVGVPTFIFINAQGVIQSIDHVLPNDYEKILSKS